MSEDKTKVVMRGSKYVTGCVGEDDLLGMVTGEGQVGVSWDGVLAIYTDKVEWTLPDELDAAHLPKLLELRAYNRTAELHATRDAMGKDLTYRVVRDTKIGGDEGPSPEARTYHAHFDDIQYLDIDSTRSAYRHYVTMGGGTYWLPVESAERVVVRNYVVYGEDDGMARIVDFRIVELLKGGKNA